MTRDTMRPKSSIISNQTTTSLLLSYYFSSIIQTISSCSKALHTLLHILSRFRALPFLLVRLLSDHHQFNAHLLKLFSFGGAFVHQSRFAQRQVLREFLARFFVFRYAETHAFKADVLVAHWEEIFSALASFSPTKKIEERNEPISFSLSLLCVCDFYCVCACRSVRACVCDEELVSRTTFA